MSGANGANGAPIPRAIIAALGEAAVALAAAGNAIGACAGYLQSQAAQSVQTGDADHVGADVSDALPAIGALAAPKSTAAVGVDSDPPAAVVLRAAPPAHPAPEYHVMGGGTVPASPPTP